MIVLSGLCFGIAAISAFSIHRLDARLSVHWEGPRTGLGYWLLPLRWLRSDRYDTAGQVLLAKLWRHLGIMVVAALSGILVGGLVGVP